MLVLSRKVNESIDITVAGKLVRLTICSFDRGKLRIGFTADRDVEILRTELVGREEAGREAVGK